jgi:hypothetical protein
MRTSKAKAAALLLGVALTGGMSACSGSSEEAAPVAQTVPATQSAAATSADAPVVFRKVTSDASLKEDYDTLDQLAASPNVKLIVSGKIVEATPLYAEGLAYTKLTVKVAKSSDSSVAAGSKIVIYRDGGVIPLSQVLPDLKDDPAAPLPKVAPANAVVDFEFMGAEQSKVGDAIVAFLHPDPNPGREGAYMPVSSVHGLLKLDSKSSKYHRLGHHASPGFQAEASNTAAEGFTRRRR